MGGCSLTKFSGDHVAYSTVIHKLSDYVPNLMFHLLQDEINTYLDKFSGRPEASHTHPEGFKVLTINYILVFHCC